MNSFDSNVAFSSNEFRDMKQNQSIFLTKSATYYPLKGLGKNKVTPSSCVILNLNKALPKPLSFPAAIEA